MTAPIAVSIGCPSGVGPEVSVVAAGALATQRILLVGDERVVARAAKLRGVDPGRFVRVVGTEDIARLARGKVGVLQPTRSLADRDVRYGVPSRAGGAAELAWVDAACDLAQRGEARAMVTGPVSKDAIVRSGAKGSKAFAGHTEHLQRRLGAREVVMAFWTATLTTALVTTHIPLRDVPHALTPAGVARTVFWLADLLTRVRPSRGVARIAVSGLNPHAGEHGLFGDEEQRVLAPGIALARRRLRHKRILAEIEGPVPAETVFRVATEHYDGIVALYHDQATIPMKLLGFGEAVNVSLGLPIVRTSVDHGTAYDVAGRGVADTRGMHAAIHLAARLSAST
jgi:4-phospho-D-threonate 3-dehydrogenase / 4-phospho-D-erythronate 3-dehydrogenase